MNVVKEVAKSEEEAKRLVLAKLNANESEVIYSFQEIKGGLFKGVSYECSGFLKLEVLDDALDYLKTIVKSMGIDANYEVTTKDDVTMIKIYSSNNPILIGKNGQNLEAITVLVRQFIRNITVNGPKIVIDASDYKDKQIQRLERLAKKLAKEVKFSKVDVEMDNMNAYERRIVHNILTDFKGVKTESVGEEPNRHVVIKYVE